MPANPPTTMARDKLNFASPGRSGDSRQFTVPRTMPSGAPKTVCNQPGLGNERAPYPPSLSTLLMRTQIMLQSRPGQSAKTLARKQDPIRGLGQAYSPPAQRA